MKSPINELLNEILEDYIKCKNEIKKNNQIESLSFNLITMINPPETTHSYLLADMLSPNGSHGQGNLFLMEFLNKIGIEKPEEGYWTITPEQGKIDILLKRKSPSSVIIIENKSNGAVDQSNQLYRYWYQAIYLSHGTLKDKHHRLIYLSPNESKKFDKLSLTKPDNGWPSELPKEINPEDIDLWYFNKHIIEWLESSLKKLDSKNHRLREYIKQYIEFCKLK